jgi:hypothetical protein
VLHAPVVDQLFANLLLAVPVEEQVCQQQQQHRSVENGCQSRDIDFTKRRTLCPRSSDPGAYKIAANHVTSVSLQIKLSCCNSSANEQENCCKTCGIDFTAS